MISHITCSPCDASFQDFLDLPSLLYPGTSKTQDLPREHLLSCIVTYNDQKPVARVALYQNPNLRLQETNLLLAGAFESIDDDEVARYLFLVVTQIAAQHNCNAILGPMNGSTWEDYRLPLSDLHRWFFTETKQPGYYSNLWQQAGFKIQHKYYSSIADIKAEYSISILGSRIRNIDLNNFEQELNGIYDMCMKSFAQNVFFSPINRNSFLNKYQQIKPFIDPDFVFIAENKQTWDVSAMVLCLPDILDPNRSTLIIKTIAKDSSAPKGIVTEMLAMLHRKAYEKGYRKMIHAFMHESNRSNTLSQLFGGNVFREYALFIKHLD